MLNIIENAKICRLMYEKPKQMAHQTYYATSWLVHHITIKFLLGSYDVISHKRNHKHSGFPSYYKLESFNILRNQGLCHV